MSSARPHIVILGGGYVAIAAARGFRRAIERGEVEVTVVSRENYQSFHGFIGEMVTGRIGPGLVLNPVRRIFPPAAVQVAEVESIDLPAQTIHLSRHLDGARYTLHYDHAILALGTTDNLEAYPGLREHGFRLKTYDDCFRLRSQIITMFELASLSPDPAVRRPFLTFFVAGGGYAGTEIAGELADFVNILTQREYKHIRRAECRVVLVHPGPTILPELYSGRGASGYGAGNPALVEFATRHMRKLGVEVLVNTRVSSITGTEVLLSDGQRIPTHTIISAVGTKPTPVLERLPLPWHASRRIETNAALQVVGHQNLWAAGDCAAMPNVKGGIYPPVGIFALHSGGHASKNILRAVRGEALQPFTYGGLGQGVSIGRRTAVGELRGIKFQGLLAWLVWRGLLVYYLPTWDRRLRLLADWLIWPLVGRDIVEMSVADNDDYEIYHHIFQPGEVLVTANQISRLVYVLTEGEAEALEGEHPTRTLHAGDYAGALQPHQPAPATIRAKTLVRATAFRTDQVKQLQAVVGALTAKDLGG